MPITNDLLHKGFGLMVFVIGLIGFFLVTKALKLELPLAGGIRERERERGGEQVEDSRNGTSRRGNEQARKRGNEEARRRAGVYRPDTHTRSPAPSHTRSPAPPLPHTLALPLS